MPVKRSDAVGKRRGARRNSRVERRTVNANVGDADRSPQRGWWSDPGWPGTLREVEVQVGQLRGPHLDRYRMTSRVT